MVRGPPRSGQGASQALTPFASGRFGRTPGLGGREKYGRIEESRGAVSRIRQNRPSTGYVSITTLFIPIRIT